jgi:TolA-binding protein
MDQLSKRFRWALFTLVVFMAVMVTMPGCAYFNTFYNTKKFYKEALEEQKRRVGDKPSSSEIQKYDKTIEKASKVLQLYPNSRYVDDVLMILGECFYHKQEYRKAQRKFQELITIFPKSGLAPHAQLWLAKTNIELNDYIGAERALKDLQLREKKGELVNQAQYFLGEIYFRQKQYALAVKEFEVAGQKISDKRMRGAAYMRLGECCSALQQYGLAAGAFRRASSTFRDDVNFTFQARLNYAMALKNDRRFDEALRILEVMLEEFRTHRDLALVKLEIADCTRLQGKTEQALKLYTAITENHQRTEASAAAFFALGEIYERQAENFMKAKECFDNVRRESARSEKVPEASRRSKAITDLIKLKENIARLKSQRDALKSNTSDSPNGANDKNKIASSLEQQANNQSINQKPDEGGSDPTKLAAELAKNKILLAELYLFQFNLPDSAMREYLDVFEYYPQTEYAPQAMYSLAFVMEDLPPTFAMRDSIMQFLATKYGHTPQGREARRRLGLVDTNDAQLQASSLFRVAEEYLFTKNDPRRALQYYQEVLEQQPDAELASKTLYAIGWIYEHHLADSKQALATYKKLIATYPDSPFAQRIRRKVLGGDQTKEQNQNLSKAAPTEVKPAAVSPESKSETKVPPPVEEEEDLVPPPSETPKQMAKPVTQEERDNPKNEDDDENPKPW